MTQPAGAAEDRPPTRGVLAGGGEMGERMRAFDWSTTPLGPVEQWPQALKTAVRLMLTSRQPMWLGWGPELTYLYNDPYLSIIGGKHPWALGRPTAEVWHEIWDDIDPLLQTALGGSEGTYVEAQLLIMERHGYPEETYYTFSYSPLPDDHGGVGGIFCANTDDTQRILGERQQALLRELAARTVEARTIAEACELGASSLETNGHDLPFALLYLVDPEQQQAVLAGSANMLEGHPAAPRILPLDQPHATWPVADVWRERVPRTLPHLATRFPQLPTGAWDRPPSQAVALPITTSGELGRGGVLIVGLSPYRLFDANYQRFVQLVASQFGAAIGNAQAYEEERRRAEALAELDRAKTTFFSNVSHEFRTPLTLMLGPIEDMLAKPEDGMLPDNRELLTVVHRNGLRLQRLVNSLLDFSRIEAGRVLATYEPTDLATLTADLASTFRSAMERAGLRLRVDCPPLDQPVYVDRDMWEKVVLNLLSNAFKHTFSGEVAIGLRAAESGGSVELTVRDTGTGIPADELPRLFERFHRVPDARARTHEGSGIGLALVQELVKLHGGSVWVESELDVGTTFTVSIPTGTAHLPAERVGVPRTQVSTATGAMPYVEEALRWLPSADGTLAEDGAAAWADGVDAASVSPGGRVLVADDNRDMREYVARLLSGRYTVETVPDGEQALAAALARPPDLVLSDVMMPRMDGFALLRALRAAPDTREVPVVLLSARAGEEAQIEGLERGADDYLVKPFSARELLARVDARIALARLQREKAETERAARQSVEQLAAERARALSEAETAVRARDEFLSIAAHELRTPITAIKGSAELALRAHGRDLLDLERAERTLRTVVTAAGHLAALTDDLLDVTRLQTGRFVLRPEQLELTDLLRRVVDRYAALPDTALVFDLQLPAGPMWLSADPVRLEQVLDNLLSNAVKYSPAGGAVEVALSADQPEHASITVRDTGIGLSPDAAETIFQPFGRARNAAASHLPGMGLGLYICRQIVEQHGGRIWAESPGEGRGTTVCLRLPLARAAETTLAER